MEIGGPGLYAQYAHHGRVGITDKRRENLLQKKGPCQMKDDPQRRNTPVRRSHLRFFSLECTSFPFLRRVKLSA